jgi:DNA-directed RNA polymerase subunit RPC12/RpoP
LRRQKSATGTRLGEIDKENMALTLFKSKKNADPRKPLRNEERVLGDVRFTVHKFNNRIKPTKKDRIKIVGCFSEFGCEIVGCLYCIPRLMRRYPGQYIIAMGWHGREYLYRHLVDEFWEIDDEHMWLRDYTRAFHNCSFNLKRLEEAATAHGQVVPSAALGKFAVANLCRTCGNFWHEWKRQTDRCPKCQSTVLVRSVFSDIATYKPQARRVPRPSQAMLDWAAALVPPNSVGVFARARKTYGRNLDPDFYVRLVALLEGMGHNVVWLGEKQSTLPCPAGHVFDFSRDPAARDLERTLAIVCNLQFTVQFWTASTRLAGLMGVPFLLFESPEQIYASTSGMMSAQEGKRLELCSFGPRKVVAAHYHNVRENPTAALALVERAVGEMRAGNWADILGMVQDEAFAELIRDEHYEMLT